jgi:hypothetical protein
MSCATLRDAIHIQDGLFEDKSTVRLGCLRS